MKRIIPFLLLAFVVAACQEDAPTVPTVGGPQFAKPDCEVDPTHPSCKDGGGGGDVNYTATDLETRRGKVGPTWAFDVSDDLGNQTVTVAGGTRVGNQYLQAMTWTVTGTDVVNGPVILPLENPDYQDVFAFGISDNGSYIVGRARESTDTAYADWVQVSAVRWDGGSGVVLPAVDVYDRAIALDVNNSGKTVGYSMGDTKEPPVVATLWNESGYPSALGSPPGLGGGSVARGINNDGHVVGASWDGEQWHAMLWPSTGAPCDLPGVGYAQDITDDNGDGTVLVAGESGTPEAYQPAVWRINPTAPSCSDVVLEHWIMDSGPQTSAWDVRPFGADGWEAVGHDESGGEQPPLAWRFDGTEITEIQLANDGRALGINIDGQIAGDARVKRRKHAMLWTPNQ
jgi:probable HAF family extracellular repeat protein